MKKFIFIAMTLLLSSSHLFAQEKKEETGYITEVSIERQADGTIVKKTIRTPKDKKGNLVKRGWQQCAGSCSSSDGTMCNISGCRLTGQKSCTSLSCTSDASEGSCSGRCEYSSGAAFIAPALYEAE